MAPTPSSKASLGKVLIIGGCGFLGHHIVDLLHESYTASITVLDLHTTRNRRPSSDGISYHEGDITTLASILPVFEKVKPDVVIHTASPTLVGGSRELYRKVNVEGTKCVIEACQQSGVKALVYTSSASVISDNKSDLINADERWPIIPPSAQTEYYSQTKVSTVSCCFRFRFLSHIQYKNCTLKPSQAEAEALVLAANRSPKLLTVSLRPSGIFGPGDVQLIPPILNLYRTQKTGWQLGPNENLFDFTYVTNVAHAHLLAARALLYASSQSAVPPAHERIDGEPFFITNDSPVYFWDFARAVWKAAGSELGTEHVWVIGREVGLALGAVLEWGFWAVGRKSRLTTREVKYSCMMRYYDVGKANKRLGYAPIVSLKEGIERSVEAFMGEDRKTGEKKDQ